MLSLTPYLITLFTLGLFLTRHFSKPLLLVFCYRFYFQQLNYSTQHLAKLIMTGQAFFTIVYCFWLECFGDLLLDYTPIMIYSVISLVEISEEMMSSVEKKKQLKENLAYFINNCQLYVLTYYLLQPFLNDSPITIWRIAKLATLFYLIKTKYGFNPFMQRIFNGTHQSILVLLECSRTMVQGYMILYRIINVVGQVYVSSAPVKRNVINVRRNA